MFQYARSKIRHTI